MWFIIHFFICIIALFHTYIFWFEMFAWTTRGPKIFTHFSKELFSKTKAFAANQGLYNGFLVAGLVWSLCIQDVEWKSYVAYFFLVCVSIAGIFGSFTVNKKIFFVQGLPALVTLLLMILNKILSIPL
ncbi:MAG: DUF1304 domain-containing protein [Chitinophagaceae bacterium]|nr:DUF1304 domain-containing protein [Chitinophagaceae bacterium]